jgi:hypothetical protein
MASSSASRGIGVAVWRDRLGRVVTVWAVETSPSVPSMPPALGLCAKRADFITQHTPNCRTRYASHYATLRWGSPSAASRRIKWTCLGWTFDGRPIATPRALADASPAIVRSSVISRSNWATAAKMPNMSRPFAVDVSMGSRKERN